MGKSRTHISVSSQTYKKAKELQQQRAKIGFHITMEDAMYYVKKEQEEKTMLGGWRI